MKRGGGGDRRYKAVDSRQSSWKKQQHAAGGGEKKTNGDGYSGFLNSWHRKNKAIRDRKKPVIPVPNRLAFKERSNTNYMGKQLHTLPKPRVAQEFAKALHINTERKRRISGIGGAIVTSVRRTSGHDELSGRIRSSIKKGGVLRLCLYPAGIQIRSHPCSGKAVSIVRTFKP